MAQGPAGWAPGRRRNPNKANKMLELRRSRADAWEESTEALETAMQTTNLTAKYLPWLVTSSAGVAIVAAIAVIYGITTGLMSNP